MTTRIMKAKIVAENKRKGLFAFCCDGDYGYFELIDSEDLNIGDVLIGDFSCLGGTSVKVVDSGETVDIFIEDFCNLSHAIQRINR